ncbi:MAG: DM13 domain-containing protein, partial [Chloroflexi bacterium]|nr:DM13 domain-containing protein [Chloroflexota bacterium]
MGALIPHPEPSMPFLGDLERFAATTLYPWRFAIAALAIAATAGFVALAIRRGWVAAARRHPGRTGALLTVAVVILAPAAWYLGSPLVVRTELQEPPPAAVGAGATAEPSASPTLVSSPDSGAPRPSAPDSTPGATPVATPGATPVVRTGSFSGADEFHFGRGRATLTEARDGSATLRFDEFSVRNGPDLYVYLSPDPAGYAEGAIELGRLRATDGSFNTPIPPGTDVTGAQSVVIWC